MLIKENLIGFFQQCVRVWHLLRKPTLEEFKGITKISALGILIIGAIGFVISVFMNVFK